METVRVDHSSTTGIVAAYGPWSAKATDLGLDGHTQDDVPDHRLRRILQTAADTVGKPLDQCRVLDLASSEGQYAIEFAMHGATVVGIERRRENIARAVLAAQTLDLPNVTFYEDDVNNLDAETYGQFEIIICSGVLHHLSGPDAYDLLQKIRVCCTGIAIIDTYIATSGRASFRHAGKRISGAVYTEHAEGASGEEKLGDLWASIGNESSFWLNEEDLLGALQDAGFSSAHECLVPFHSPSTDRRTYLAMCGARINVRSSAATRNAADLVPRRRDVADLHPSQKPRSLAFKIAKRVLPQGLKDMIKPTLRKSGVLDTKEAPAFMKTTAGAMSAHGARSQQRGLQA